VTRSMGDSAWPPGTYPAVDAWGFYVHGDTPHTWTDQEIADIPCRYLLPIVTRNIGGDPAQDAAALIAWCRAHHQPPGTLTALDFEDRVDPAYLRAYDAAVTAAGWLVAVYGQQSTVLGNPRPSGGYWVANWDRDASAARVPAGWAARQYAGDTQLGHPWDLSTVPDSTPLWDTRRQHTSPQTGAGAAGAHDWRNDMHIDLAMGEAKVFTPTAAALGGTCTLLLSCDFGDATVRVAVFSFSKNTWTVTEHQITSTGGADSIELTADANKVSLVYTDGTATAVGADVY